MEADLEDGGALNREESEGPCPASPHLPISVHICPHLPISATSHLAYFLSSRLTGLAFPTVLKALVLPPSLHPPKAKHTSGRPLLVTQIG